jgi:hypothetical protein
MESKKTEIKAIDALKSFVISNFKHTLARLSSKGSGLNSACCAISGYALYLGYEDYDSLEKDLLAFLPSVDSRFYVELDRVFHPAKYDNYGKWWENEDNRKTYKL